MDLLDLLIGEAAPDHLHDPVIRKLLEVDDQRGLIDLPGQSESHGATIGFHKTMGIFTHGRHLGIT